MTERPDFSFRSILFLAIFLTVNGQQCSLNKNKVKCGCVRKDGKMIDLIRLIDKKSPLPLFADIKGDPDGNTYFLDPCRDFDQGTLKGVSACQQSSGTPTSYYSLGSQNSMNIVGDKDNYTLVFSSVLDGYNRSAYINLICITDQSTSIKFIKEDKNESEKYSHYIFELRSKQVCLTLGSNRLSTGSILLITFFVSLAVYFIAGFLFLKFVRGANGVETIPNYEFWRELPSLIKDGFNFTVSGCKVDTTYDQI